MGILRILLVAILAINALFWGLWPHGKHCAVAGAFGLTSCPSHWVHILTGVVFFFAAILVAQWGYITAPSKK